MPVPVAQTTTERAQALLGELAGPTAILRDDQLTAIRSLVDERRRVLVVQRTGWGKSAVYFIAAKLLREQGLGPTILVSPLLALMRDQIAAARRMGLSAVTINSANADEWAEVEAAIASDGIDLLAISPERLNNRSFLAGPMAHLAARAGLVVVDEAHCVSAWGHDFRPDYMRIRDVLARLQPDTPVLATTATATDLVVDDVAGQLGAEPVTLRGTLDRGSLVLSVVRLGSPAERLAWLAEQLPRLPGSGIVYCLTQAATQQTAAWLAGQGVAAAAYTGSTDPEARERLEAALRDNGIKALVATSALGMGYDKPDLGFVVNLGAPSSITAYYQMVGRAGRALDRAEVVLLPGEEDQRIWTFFDSVAFPTRPLADAVVGTLDRSRGPLSEAGIEAMVDIRRTRLTTMLKVLDVEGAVDRVKGGWIRTDRPWTYDEARYERVRAARRADQVQMLEYEDTTECRMTFLRRALDDPEVASGEVCGRCDNCTGVRWAADVSAAAVETIERVARDADVIIEGRKMWPSGLELPKGKIPDASRALDGRALTEADAAGWGAVVRSLLDGGPEVTAPEEVIHGLVGVLKRWGWPEGRPTWVTWIPSARRPLLARSLAEALGRIGRLELHDTLVRDRTSPPQVEMGNSAHACANVFGAFNLAAPASSFPPGPVLVVDDTWVSGWTMTVVADLFGSADLGPVYPLVLQKG